jgi:hypothetical protein
MIRFLNFVAVAALVGTAVWVYSIKYETIYFAEQVKKLENRLDREHAAIIVLKAEWQYLNQPARLQGLADKFLDSKPLEARQIIKASELPDRPPPSDEIGAKLDQLITGSTTPSSKGASPRTPGRR